MTTRPQPKRIGSVLENFENTIRKNNESGVSSNMYLSNLCSVPSAGRKMVMRVNSGHSTNSNGVCTLPIKRNSARRTSGTSTGSGDRCDATVTTVMSSTSCEFVNEQSYNNDENSDENSDDDSSFGSFAGEDDDDEDSFGADDFDFDDNQVEERKVPTARPRRVRGGRATSPRSNTRTLQKSAESTFKVTFTNTHTAVSDPVIKDDCPQLLPRSRCLPAHIEEETDAFDPFASNEDLDQIVDFSEAPNPFNSKSDNMQDTKKVLDMKKLRKSEQRRARCGTTTTKANDSLDATSSHSSSSRQQQQTRILFDKNRLDRSSGHSRRSRTSDMDTTNHSGSVRSNMSNVNINDLPPAFRAAAIRNSSRKSRPRRNFANTKTVDEGSVS